MRKRLIIGAVIASVGLAGATAAASAAGQPHGEVAQLRWVGAHPDTSTDAPAGKQKVYVVDVQQNTIRYVGTQPDDQAKMPG